MTESLSSAAVTQTWQVGPNVSPRHIFHLNEEEEETLVFSQVKSTFFQVDCPTKGTRKFEILGGIHSFVSFGSSVNLIEGPSEQALFLVNVTAAGNFLLRGGKEVILNNRRCHKWSRLRQGDKIQVAGCVFTYDPFEKNDLDETIVMGKKNTGHVFLSSNKKTTSRRNIKIWWKSFAASGLSALIASFAYYWLTLPPNMKDNFSHHKDPQILGMSEESLSAAAILEPELNEKLFFALVEQYRAGDFQKVCEKIEHFMSRQDLENVWYEKARLFFGRKCK